MKYLSFVVIFFFGYTLQAQDYELVRTNSETGAEKILKFNREMAVVTEEGKLRGYFKGLDEQSLQAKQITGFLRTDMRDWDIDSISRYSYRSNGPKYLTLAGTGLFLAGVLSADKDDPGLFGAFEGTPAVLISTGAALTSVGMVWNIGQQLSWKDVSSHPLSIRPR